MVKTKVERFRAHDWRTYRGNASGSHTAVPNSGIDYANGNQDLLVSEGHNVSRLGSGDVGGPFHVVRRELSEFNFGPIHNRTVVAASDDNINARNYLGRYYADDQVVTNSSFPAPVTATTLELNAAGTTAIARIIPTNPLAGLAVTLGELRREGIPAVLGSESIRSRALNARNAGSDYLNYEFGWRPLVNEVLALAHAITDSDELVRKYVEESGRRLHRAYTYPVETSTTTSTATGTYPKPTILLAYFKNPGTTVTTTTTKVERWFNGCFTYHLAPPGSLARQEQIAAKRFGHRITPEALWALTPWSWAADWVTNIGDVAHNVSAFANDGLVMPYGYMMMRRTITKSVSHYGSVTQRHGLNVSCSQTFTTTVKQRAKATPFGFGLDTGTFSNRQWAILAALGLSRGRGDLN